MKEYIIVHKDDFTQETSIETLSSYSSARKVGDYRVISLDSTKARPDQLKGYISFTNEDISEKIELIENGNFVIEKRSEFELDDTGRQIIRTAATKKGWHYQYREIEVSTSEIAGAVSYGANGELIDGITCKIFDANGGEITNPLLKLTAVKTEVVFGPTYNYEILGGKMHFSNAITVDMRMSVYAGAVDLGLAYCKEFVPSINLKHISPDRNIDTDGRASKFLSYETEGVPVPTNKVKFVFRYPITTAKTIAVGLELFRE